MSQPIAVSTNAWHGFLFGLASYGIFNVMDILVKKLSVDYSVFQILAFVLFLSLPFVYIFVRWRAGPQCMQTHAPHMQVIRGALFFVYSGTAFYGLQHLPLANFYTFIFTTPLFTTMFAMIWLKERVKLLQIVLMLVSFLGVIVAFRPDPEAINTVALIVLAGTVAGALGQAIIRRQSASEGLGATIIYPEIVTACLALYFASGSFHWPDMNDWILFGIAGILCAAANSLLVLAFYLAPASQVTPTQYSQIIWGVLYGYFLFGDVPDLWIISGAALIIGAGIWLARIEYQSTHGQHG